MFSSIKDPINGKEIKVYEWQVKFCNGDHCAAALLSFFIKNHDLLMEHTEKEKLQCFSYKELENSLLGLYSKRRIPQSIKLLIDIGAISMPQNTDSKNKAEEPFCYLLHPEICNKWIAKNYPKS